MPIFIEYDVTIIWRDEAGNEQEYTTTLSAVTTAVAQAEGIKQWYKNVPGASVTGLLAIKAIGWLYE